jgi:hypothetical protein
MKVKKVILGSEGKGAFFESPGLSDGPDNLKPLPIHFKNSLILSLSNNVQSL